MKSKLILLTITLLIKCIPAGATVMSLAIAANQVANGNLQQLGPAAGAIGLAGWAELLARFFVL